MRGWVYVWVYIAVSMHDVYTICKSKRAPMVRCYINVCLYICMYACICIYVCMYVCVCIYIYACMYMYTYDVEVDAC